MTPVLGVFYIQRAINWLWDRVVDGVTQLFGLVWDLVGQLFEWGIAHLPASFQTFLQTRPWESFFEFTDDVNYFLPIYNALGIMGTAYAIIGTIRVARWMKSFVPTISG